MSVYHWTTTENWKTIQIEGLREGSFVCASPDDWRGDVCLEIKSLNIHVNEETWQGITHRHVLPDEITLLRKSEKRIKSDERRV